jgi:hypothetical protein
MRCTRWIASGIWNIGGCVAPVFYIVQFRSGALRKTVRNRSTAILHAPVPRGWCAVLRVHSCSNNESSVRFLCRSETSLPSCLFVKHLHNPRAESMQMRSADPWISLRNIRPWRGCRVMSTTQWRYRGFWINQSRTQQPWTPTAPLLSVRLFNWRQKNLTREFVPEFWCPNRTPPICTPGNRKKKFMA